VAPQRKIVFFRAQGKRGKEPTREHSYAMIVSPNRKKEKEGEVQTPRLPEGREASHVAAAENQGPADSMTL